MAPSSYSELMMMMMKKNSLINMKGELNMKKSYKKAAQCDVIGL